MADDWGSTTIYGTGYVENEWATGKRGFSHLNAPERAAILVMRDEGNATAQGSAGVYPDTLQKILGDLKAELSGILSALYSSATNEADKLVNGLSQLMSFLNSKLAISDAKLAAGSQGWGSNPIYMSFYYSTKLMVEAQNKFSTDQYSYYNALLKIDADYQLIYEAKAFIEAAGNIDSQFYQDTPKLLSNLTASASTVGDQPLVQYVTRLNALLDQQQALLLRTLPDAAKNSILAKAGSLSGLTRGESMGRLINAARQFSAEVRQVAGAISPGPKNPNISAPLIGMELNALNALINEQLTTDLGTKWLAYHQVLANSEMARVTDWFAALLGLVQGYANQADTLRHQAQLRLNTAYNVLAMPMTTAPALTITGEGLVNTVTGAAVSLAESIAKAVSELGRVAMAGPGAYVATFATLMLYSPSTASEAQDQTPDSVRYGLGVDAQSMGLSSTANLAAAAQTGGTVQLPMRMTEFMKDGTASMAVVATNGVTVPREVPVRAANYNSATGRYEVVAPVYSEIPGTSAITLTWTPAEAPGASTSSTARPIAEQPIPIYNGSQITPNTPQVEVYPGKLISVEDMIIWFPVNSGIKPIYIVFSNPLDSGIFTRSQLQKKYDSHGADFGFAGQSANGKTLSEFREKIVAHLDDPATIAKGTYHREKDSVVHYNPGSNIVVILKSNGMFLSGWKIAPGTDQYNTYMNTGVL